MDIRVQELLEKIKKEGMDKAEADGRKLLAEARAKADSMIAAAEREARAMGDKARADAARTEEAGRAALAQASRDLVLAFRSEIDKMLAAMVRAEVDAAFDAETVKKALPGILEAWSKDGHDDLSVLVAPRDLASIEAFFRDRLGSALKKGVELKPHGDIKSGFRIAEKGGAAYYDFSAQAVAGMIGSYLNTRTAEIAVAAVSEPAK